MEDNKQDQNNTPSGGGVMDVQPPGGPQPNAPGAPAPNNIGSTIPADMPSSEQPQPQGGLSPDLLAQAEAEMKKPDAQPDEKLLAAHGSHRKGPKLIIVLAVVVALALAGVAVYAYIQSRDDSKRQDTHTSDNQESSEDHVEPASAKDVEDAAKELDETVNATNEAQEIPGEGLSEDAVGL